jgi:type VI secretion system protein VasD
MSRFFRSIILVAMPVLIAAACGKAPPLPPPVVPPSITIAAPVTAKTKATMTLAAGKDCNPDASGRPSPVVVRIYQLKTDAAFKAADFMAFLDDDRKTLGVELISRDEFVLEPSERQTVEVVVGDETRFVGAFADFKDYRNPKAQWRALIPKPPAGFTVNVEGARIAFSLAE